MTADPNPNAGQRGSRPAAPAAARRSTAYQQPAYATATRSPARSRRPTAPGPPPPTGAPSSPPGSRWASSAPLIIMLTIGNQSPYVRKHAVESLNFQISLLIYGAAAVLFSLVTLGLGLIVVIPLGWSPSWLCWSS